MLDALLTSSFHVEEGSSYVRVALEDVQSERLSAWKRSIQAFPKCAPKGPWMTGTWVQRFLCGEQLLPWVGPPLIDYAVPTVQDGQILRSRLEMMERWSPYTCGLGVYAYEIIVNENLYRLHIHAGPTYNTLDAYLDTQDYTIQQVGWDGVGFRVGLAAHRHLQTKELHLVHPVTPDNRERLWNQILPMVDQGFSVGTEMIEHLLHQPKDTADV